MVWQAANLVTADEFVREGKSWHDTAGLEPEDRCERSREENTLHSGICDDALTERGLLV